MKRVIVFGILFMVLVSALVIYLSFSRRVESDKLILSGVIEAVEYDLSFRISGQITEIFYDEGDLIDSNVVVAVLDTTELSAIVGQAHKSYEAFKASITQLEVQLETIQRNLSKIKQLLPTGGSSQSQYDDLADQKRQVKAQLESARKNLEAAKAIYELAEIRLGYAVLKSFISGKVINRMHEPGEVITAGAPVITIANLEDLTVKIYLPEIYLGKVKLGQEVAIQVDSYPQKSLPGKIKYISDKAEFTPKNIQTKEERVKQVFAIKISSSSHGGILKPGLPCDVIISLR